MRTILVVEDEPQIATLVRDYLEHAGFAVLTAGDGQGALALARARRPDALVLDLGLPRLDGLDVIRAIRRDSRVPILILSVRAAIAVPRISGLAERARRLSKCNSASHITSRPYSSLASTISNPAAKHSAWPRPGSTGNS